METLAYLYAATDYQESEAISGLEDGFATPQPLNWHKVSAQTATSLLAIACSLSVLGAAGAASALQRDDSGTDVTTLQSDLLRAGYYDGPVTGFYGELTESAVSRFQSANGLVVDGVAGSQTLEVLQGRAAATQASSTTSTAGGTLQRGDQGAAVTDLQNRLRNAGYFNGPVTGYFGGLTEAAVTRFQEQKGLVADGQAGSQTLLALRQTSTQTSRSTSSSEGSSAQSSSAQGGPATSVNSAVLTRGDRGTNVAELQNRLRNAGYFNGPMTGFYGSLTEQAVTQFQQAKGLAMDGKAGPRTLGALLQSPNSQQSSQRANTARVNTASSNTARPGTAQANARPQPNAAQRSLSPNPQPTPLASVRPTTQPTSAPSASATQAPAPTASAPVSDRVLQRGDGGPEVAALQTALKRTSYLNGQVTGFFGQLTEQALIKFQSANGLSATGKADGATLTALQRLSGENTNEGAVLEKGDSGAAVADLQNRLRNAGYFDGPMTGYYGDFTETAVAEFQRAKGLTADGKAGPQTLAALR